MSYKILHYHAEVLYMNPAYHEFYRVMGLNIAYYRNLKDLSQEQLGDRLGLPQSHISKIERAAAGISMDMLCAIAEALDVPPHKLLEPK